MKKTTILTLAFLAILGFLAVANVASADFEIVTPPADEAVADSTETPDEATDGDEAAAEDEGDAEEATDEAADTEEPATEDEAPEPTEPEESKVVEETPPPPPATVKKDLETSRQLAADAKAKKDKFVAGRTKNAETRARAAKKDEQNFDRAVDLLERLGKANEAVELEAKQLEDREAAADAVKAQLDEIEAALADVN